MLINAIRAHMAELGYVMAQGKSGIGDLMAMILGEPPGYRTSHATPSRLWHVRWKNWADG
jgi:hypothetical protein